LAPLCIHFIHSSRHLYSDLICHEDALTNNTILLKYVNYIYCISLLAKMVTVMAMDNNEVNGSLLLRQGGGPSLSMKGR
jgi:hypothetical protein